MKTLFKFESNKVITDKTEIKEKDAEGKEITILKDIERKVPYNFALAKPTNSLTREGSKYLDIWYNDAVRSGFLSRAQTVKRLNNDEKGQSLFSDSEIKEFDELKSKLFKNREEFNLLFAIKELERTEEQKKRYQELTDEMYSLMKSLRSYEQVQEAQFNHTAETYSYGRLVIFYLLHLSYVINDKGEFSCLFNGKNYEEKLSSYDNILEGEDEWLKSVVKDFLFLVTFWANGAGDTEDDFKRVLEEARKSSIF